MNIATGLYRNTSIPCVSITTSSNRYKLGLHKLMIAHGCPAQPQVAGSTHPEDGVCELTAAVAAACHVSSTQ